MTINLYYNSSENNNVNKNLQLIFTTQAILKNDTTIIDPVLILSNIDNFISSINYLEIPELSRKYFIMDIKSIRNNLWEFKCHIDVLTTYSSKIKEQKAIIKRQENKWNLYLDDGIFKTYQNPYIITKAFPNGFKTQNFVLAISGG